MILVTAKEWKYFFKCQLKYLQKQCMKQLQKWKLTLTFTK